MKNFTKFICLLISILFFKANAQIPTFTISNVTVNGQPIINNTINFGDLDQITVRYRVDFEKSNYLHIGSVKYINGLNNNNGFVQLFNPETLYLVEGNTGFTDLREYVLHADNYSSCNNNQNLGAYMTVIGSNINYESNKISIKKNPRYTLNSSSNNFNCDLTTPITFNAVTNDCINGAILSYKWSIGSGWVLPNGSTPPANITTTTSNIVLIPINYQPATIVVTPIFNNQLLQSSSKTIIISPFSSTSTLTGNSTLCLGGTGIYSLNNLEVGNTVTWSISNTSTANISNATQSQVTVNGVANGLVNLVATITNPCGQTVTKTKTLNIGVPILPNANNQFAGVVYGELWVRKNFFPQTLSFPAILGANSYNWAITINPDFPTTCPSTGAIAAKFSSNNLQTISTTTPNASINFGNCLGQYIVTCTVTNQCGSTTAYERYVTVGNTGTSPCFIDLTISKTFIIKQNPIKNNVIILAKKNSTNNENIDLDIDSNDQNIVSGDEPCETEWPMEYIPTTGKKANKKISNTNTKTEIKITIFDFFGAQLYSKILNVSNEEIELKDSNLTSGKYIIHISDGLFTQKEIIIVE